MTLSFRAFRESKRHRIEVSGPLPVRFRFGPVS